MKPKQSAGIVLLVAAGVAGYWGYERSQSLAGKLGKLVEGAPSNEVIIAYGAAAVLAVVGLLLIKRR